MEVRDGEISRPPRSRPIEREPVTGGEPAVLAYGIARVVAGDRELLPEPKIVDEILDKERVATRRRQREPHLRKKHACLIHPLFAVEARKVVKRFRTVRALVEGRERLAQEPALVLERPEATRLLKAGVPGLLVPSAHFRPLGVGLDRLRSAAGVPQRLGEIELIAMALGLRLQRLAQ